MFGSLRSLMLGKEARHVLIDQPLLHFGNREDVAIADDQIDVIKRDAFSVQAIVDHLLVETGGVLFTRDPLLGDGKRDGAVAQQAGTDIMVVGIQAENVGVLFGHRRSLERISGGLIDLSGLRGWTCLSLSHILPSHIFGRFETFIQRTAAMAQCTISANTAPMFERFLTSSRQTV